MKKIFFLLSLFLILALSCSKDNDDPQISDASKASDYCLMFYMSGGDSEHDAVFNLYKEAMTEQLSKDYNGIGITWLFKPSATGSTTLRYYTNNSGQFIKDDSWAKTGYKITEATSLTEFINWSASQFPNKKYILITGGHGNVWDPSTDDPKRNTTKGLMYDGEYDSAMTATDVTRGIENSTIKKIDLLITNNCAQNCIENLTEWQSAMNYVIATSSYLPDLGGDYSYLISHIGTSASLKEDLKNYVNYVGKFFFPYSDFYGTDTKPSISAIDMTEIPNVNSALKKIFSKLEANINNISVLTDSPCEPGRSYGQGYYLALNNTHSFDYVSGLFERRTNDLYEFLLKAQAYSGDNTTMMDIDNVKTAMDKAIIACKSKIVEEGGICSFNIYTNVNGMKDKDLGIYRTSLFDQQTGWSNLYTQFMEGK